MNIVRNYLVSIFFVIVPSVSALDKYKNLPPIAQDWIRVTELSKIDISELKSIKKIPSTNEIYHGVLPDNNVIIASRSNETNTIHCSRWTKDNSTILLEDKYFDVLKDLYIFRLMKK